MWTLLHHNNLWLGHSHRHISTSLPLQLGLGLEELSLEGGREQCWYMVNSFVAPDPNLMRAETAIDHFILVSLLAH